MAELIEIGEQQERVILFAASTNASDDTEESVEELRELVKTAGAETVGVVIQNRENIHPGTYLGKGKIQELKEMVWETGATGVVCDDELSPAQLKNLEDALDTKVMDRTMIILDIFAARAKTKRRKDPGGTCAAPIPRRPPCGTQEFPVEAWRRNRYEGTRRDET